MSKARQTTSFTRNPRLLLASAFVAASVWAPAQAQQSTGSERIIQAAQGDDASERIALAGKLGMLSQRVVSSACFLQAGIEPDSSRSALQSATAEFAAISAALEFGDPALGVIAPEERRRTLAGLERLSELWMPIDSLTQKIDAGTATTDDIMSIATQSVDLRDIADRLVVEITGQYASQTTVLQSDAVRLDLATRQTTLAQVIAKDGCLISRGIAADGSTAEIGRAADNFTTSLDALRFGLQEVGIQPPPNPDIADSLAEVANNWSFMSRIVSDLAAGNQVDEITLGVMFLMSNQVTDNMEKVVDLYSDASKLNL